MTSIEWTQRPGTKGESWNPIIARRRSDGKRGWFCAHVSEGCRNCYAEAMNRWRGNTVAYKSQNRAAVELELHGPTLEKPLHWRKPRTVFVCSMTDLFAGFHDIDLIAPILAAMALAEAHTFIVLTKRPERAREILGRDQELLREWIGAWPLPNVWLGTSVEDQAAAEARIPALLETPAALRFLSVEPMLGPVDLRRWLAEIDWVIAGGESGPAARPPHPDWFRAIRDQCRAFGVPFFLKQWGCARPEPRPSFHRGSGCFAIDRAGRVVEAPAQRGDYPPGASGADGWAWMRRFRNKEDAGAQLDGREWREFPA